MSTQYPGGFITKSPVAPTTTAASGIWTVDQALQYVKAGTWPTPPIFIEDLFSTYLYNGNEPNSVTVNNGIDLSTKGGLVWIKARETAKSNWLWDTARGTGSGISSNSAGAPVSFTGVSAFNTNGFTVGSDAATNDSTRGMVSWTFRKQPKFFDVVAYTGDGVTGRILNHSLDSVPGFVIFKRTSSTGDWQAWHRGSDAQFLLGGIGLFFNTIDAANPTTAYGAAAAIMNAAPTSTTLSLKIPNYDSSAVNELGQTYVAYLFAHNAGGFPANGGGSTNGISCGSFVTSGTGTPNATITLGYEPQWVMVKKSSGTGNWTQFDNMRGLLAPNGLGSAYGKALYPNLTNAEGNSALVNITPTGFVADTGNTGETWIYIAIRRGPMKTPTVGTSVYNAISRTGTGATANVTGVGFPPDMLLDTMRSTGWNRSMWDRLRGANKGLKTNDTGAEASYTDAVMSYNQDGVTLGADGNFDVNASGYTYINWFFRRAPSFFDEVCYTGTGAITSFTHNLGVAPELMIVKARSTGVDDWVVYVASLGYTRMLYLNGTSADLLSSNWGGANPTSSVFSVGAGGRTNTSGTTYVNYLFATCPGVSKVGSYTGTGATQTISCGFTGGARFVLIRNTDPGGAWYVWDTARGMVAGTDPSLQLNSTAAEVNANSIYTTTGGFQIVSTAAGINGSGLNYIFLAIA